jgi:hypothetical protein
LRRHARERFRKKRAAARQARIEKDKDTSPSQRKIAGACEGIEEGRAVRGIAQGAFTTGAERGAQASFDEPPICDEVKAAEILKADKGNADGFVRSAKVRFLISFGLKCRPTPALNAKD